MSDFDWDFEESDEDEDVYQDPETGVKTMFVEARHFMFWPCKCGHVFGRHGGELLSSRMMDCFDCKCCKKFFPAQSLEKWRGEQKLTPTLKAWEKSKKLDDEK